MSAAGQAAADGVFVAVDVGSSGARALAIGLEGQIVHEARAPYSTSTPRAGWAEQDPRDWLEMAVAAMSSLVAALGDRARINAIGLTGQTPTVAPADRHGRPIGIGMMYRDNRATVEAAEMRDRFGTVELHRRTGHAPEAFHIGPKLLWLRRHKPELFARTERFLQPRDFILTRLTGTLATEGTHASSTLLFDLRGGDWDPGLLESFALDRSLFPDVLPSDAVAGEVTAVAARETGLPKGCPVIVGAADSQCAAFASGVIDPGPVSEMAGSSSCVNTSVVEPLSDPRVTHYPHVVAHRYSTELGINTTGAAVRWALNQLRFDNFDDLQAAARRMHATLTRSSGDDDPCAAAPLFLPYLGDGDRTDTRLRAGFIGLSERHDRDALAYAVLEGISFAVADTLDDLRGAGVTVEDLRVAGGSARLAALGAIKADALAVPVLHMQVDTAPVGAALLAAHGAGLAVEAQSAIDAVVQAAVRHEPDEAGVRVLRRRREWFSHVRDSAAVRAFR